MTTARATTKILLPTTKISIEDFRSEFEALMAPEAKHLYTARKVAEGMNLAREGYEMHVSINGTWSARRSGMDEDSSIYSYEKLGYHSCAEKVLEGFLFAGGKVYFHGYRNIHGEVVL